MNGAGIIHDYELARVGATTESEARYIRSGEFGFWQETGELNGVIRQAAKLSLGLGENVGRRIAGSEFPYKNVSIVATAYRLSIPVTAHVGIGYDIIHEHPTCDGGAVSGASYRDFLIFAKSVVRGGLILYRVLYHQYILMSYIIPCFRPGKTIHCKTKPLCY
jgi:hypothetical protein